MRAISLIIALAVVVTTTSMAGTKDTLPGAGTFAFEHTAPISQTIVVASR
jgi:hypothetical protein